MIVFAAHEVFSHLVPDSLTFNLIFNIKILPISIKFGEIGRILTLMYFWFTISNLDLKLIKLITSGHKYDLPPDPRSVF